MNKKVKLSLLTIITLSLTVGTTMLISNNNPMALFLSQASNNPYSLKFNKDKNKFHNKTGATPASGTALVHTELGGEIVYTYSNIIGGGTSTWHVLSASDSYFYNQDPINGVNCIQLNFKTNDKQFKIYWSNNTTFSEEHSQVFTSNSSSSTVFNFDNFNPNYIKVENISGSNLNISEITYKYSCTNQYYHLTRTSGDEQKGTVSGDSGTIKAGTEVSVSASALQCYKFDGWYSYSTKVSDANPYVFDMPYSDLDLVAKFIPEKYTLSVSSNDETKGTVTGSGDYDYLSKVTVVATPNEGYELDGWYDGNTKVSSDLSYTFTMPCNNYSLLAKFKNKTYTLLVSSNDETKGNVKGSGSYLYESSVTLTATSKIGCHFVGWYDGDDLVSTNFTYTFTMPHNDLTYIGKFEYTLYSLTVISEDVSKGTATGSGDYIYGEEVTINASPADGYIFFGWFKDDELLSRDVTYTYKILLEDVCIVAKFSKLYNLYIESDDIEMGSVIFPSNFGEGLEVTIKGIPNEGYAFNYWYNEDYEEVSYDWYYSFIMPSSDVTLYANFIEGGNKVNVEYSLEEGLVDGDFNYLEGQTVTLIVTPADEYVFEGWYKDSSYHELLNKDKIYSFIMPDEEVRLYARFITKAEQEWKISHGVIPTISEDGKTIMYGLYPQTNISDNVLISKLNELKTPEENGWYLYDDEYYAKTLAKPNDSSYVFNNGNKIVKDNTYWFKCEPIKWNILSNNDGTYFLLSSVLLDAHKYDGSSNNYMNSEIRSWLNSDFYSSAFNLENSHILTTLVDNSAETTGHTPNQYACNNTNDKIFLPSYLDYTNSSYKFSNACKTTDWARAKGAYYSKSSSYLYNGSYWTRSPYYSQKNYARSVFSNGNLDYNNVDYANYGVRPALMFTF
ncbi:MAG: InlB B-repeat-containing protein [Bacilli bacterium]|nr:InlB B-repeat-containing protein [Bacilli bacterium]